MQTPRSHQVDAISSCVGCLRKPHSRGQCIMACGTGKTLVGYEVARGLKARRLLTLVPSLLLVNQMIREYRARGAKHILAVCSDETSGDEDSIQISVKELEADNTTDAKVARAFLDGPGQRIVVCTYQSLRSLSEVFESLAFDLAIFDEAHKTAGRKSKLFAHGLTDDSVKCARRLFMTATPRHAALKEDGSEAQVYAMNDPKIYGPVLYSLSLHAAIEAGIIDDYQIIIAVVSQRGTEDLKEQAIRVAIDRAMQVYGIRKVFTFHARVADASNFILGATDTLKSARLYHVNGMQSSAERGIKLEGFRNADAALMSNARCLTEGVDLPAADMVAFLSPKKNPIDIVQAVGRVLRKHHSKAKGGYVFLPVFMRDGADEEAAIAESDWSSCYEVLQAMREQDDPMSVQLAKAARGNGELPDKIIIMDGRRHGVSEMEVDRVDISEGIRRAIRVKILKPFNRDPERKKAEILAKLRNNPKRLEGNDPLRAAYASYTNPNSQSFDLKFCNELSKIFPTYNRGDSYKWSGTELLQLALKGGPRPERLFIGAHSFDDLFDLPENRFTGRGVNPESIFLRRTLLHLVPHWFKSRALLRSHSARGLHPKRKKSKDQKIQKLLAIAQEGGPRPRPHTQLAHALENYLPKSSRVYVAGLSEKLKNLAPHWFRKKGSPK
jgi:predicted helicase